MLVIFLSNIIIISNVTAFLQMFPMLLLLLRS